MSCIHFYCVNLLDKYSSVLCAHSLFMIHLLHSLNHSWTSFKNHTCRNVSNSESWSSMLTRRWEVLTWIPCKSLRRIWCMWWPRPGKPCKQSLLKKCASLVQLEKLRNWTEIISLPPAITHRGKYFKSEAIYFTWNHFSCQIIFTSATVHTAHPFRLWFPLSYWIFKYPE